jgi:simple sugar transport system permease protein
MTVIKKAGRRIRSFFVSDGSDPSGLLQLSSKRGFQTFFASVLCILIGLFVGFVILLCINAKGAPEAIWTILKNYFNYSEGNDIVYYFGSTLVRTAPLIMTSLAVTFAYKAGLFNIGAAGQYVVGAGASIYAALAWHMPWYICTLLALLAGAAWGGIVGWLKAYFNVNEVISSIMLNWIGLYAVNMLMQNSSAVMDPSISETWSLRKKARDALLPSLGLDKLFNDNKYVTIAIFIAIIAAVIIAVILNKTTFGYELKATGNNRHAARYCGMNGRRNIILTMAISGALAGTGAALLYLTDIDHWITASSLPSMGFDGIASAFLGGLSPVGVIFSSYFIKHIAIGGSKINLNIYSSDISGLIISIIIYLCAFVLFIREIMTRRILSKREEKKKEENEPEKGTQGGDK